MHKQILIETTAKQVFSLVKNWALSYFLLKYVFGIQISHAQNVAFTMCMFFQSFATEYGMRYMFHKWYSKE